MTKKLKKQLMELILFAGLILWAVFNYKLFIDFVGFAFKLVMPLIVGVAIAFMCTNVFGMKGVWIGLVPTITAFGLALVENKSISEWILKHEEVSIKKVV